jgi:hypothetical protein
MPHREQHLTSSVVLQDIVIGLSDGLTVPFALAAGLSGAVQSSGLVITAGLSEIVAGSIAMGLGGYLAGRTEVDHYAAELAREHEEVRTVPDIERREVQELLVEMGLSEATATQATAELVQDPAQWVRFMMKYELGLEEPDPRQAQRLFLHGYAAGWPVVVGAHHPRLPTGVWLFSESPHGPATRAGRPQNGGHGGLGGRCSLFGSPAI